MLFPFKIALKVMAIALAIVVAYFGITLVQIWMTGRESSTNHADAIVVFGSAQYDGVPSLDLKARLDEALTLFHQGRAPLVAVTGGKLAGDVFSEAGVSAAYLIARGVPAAQIISGGGNDTYENVSSVADPLKARGVKTVLVVTDRFHEDRAMAICSTFGFSPSPAPTTNSPLTGGKAITYYLREMVAVGVGRIVGYGVLSNASHPGG